MSNKILPILLHYISTFDNANC